MTSSFWMTNCFLMTSQIWGKTHVWIQLIIKIRSSMLMTFGTGCYPTNKLCRTAKALKNPARFLISFWDVNKHECIWGRETYPSILQQRYNRKLLKRKSPANKMNWLPNFILAGTKKGVTSKKEICCADKDEFWNILCSLWSWIDPGQQITLTESVRFCFHVQ
jgi:hypothetical protein